MSTNPTSPSFSHGPGESQYEQLVASIDGIVWELDTRTFQFTFVSQQAQRLLGYPLEQWFTPGFWVNHLHQDDSAWALEFCLQAAREKRSHDFEYRMIAADGRTVWLRDIVSVVVEGGEAVKLRGVMVDITDHKQTEQALRESEELYRLLTEYSNDLVTLLDSGGRHVYASPSFKRTLGQVPNMTFERVHPEDLPTTRRAWAEVLAGEQRLITFRYRDPNNSWRWLEGWGGLVQYQGKPHVLGVSRDITERKLAEEERQTHLWFFESMDQVNRAVQGTDDLEQMMSDVLDTVLTIFQCNRAWLVYPCDPEAQSWRAPMERTRPEFPGALRLGLEVPLDPDVVRVFQTVRASPGPVRFGPGSQHALPEETTRRFNIQSQISMAIYPKVDKPYMFGLHQCAYPRHWKPQEERLFQEIGRRLADALTSLLVYRNLRNSESKLTIFRSLIDQSNAAVEVVDPETGRYLDVNDRACLDHGYSRAEYLALTVPQIDPLMTVPRWEEFKKEIREVGSRVFESQHWRKDGSIFPVEVNVNYIRLERDYLLAVVQDISERKRSEQALMESHSLLHAVVEGTPDAIFVKDLQGRYLMINSAGARFLGKTVDEIVGQHDRDLFTADTAQTVIESDRQVMATGQSQMFEETATAAGVTRTYLATKDVYRDAPGNVIGLIGISRDITELKQLEEQFRQAQKMEAVGRLAGGVAHDFNNLLTVINGYSELVFSRLREDDPSRELLAEVRKCGERAANLTRQLLAFSRKQVLQPQVVSLHTLLGELYKLLQHLIGEDIELALESDAALGLAKVDPGQFEQAIINLAVNARDAMPKGGRLIIRTHNAELDEDYAARHPEVKPGRYVAVFVNDSGQGMDAATRARIFEPFFTTKGIGKGTGLGLAMVYGFVKQSGGHIEVASELGHGTTFMLYLPCAEETRPSALASLDLLTIPRGTETVLLVEDEEAVRSLSRLVLQSSGYTVLEARDGQEAVWVAQQHQGPIHILVTDLVMPRMSGRQLADLFAQARPNVRVLFISGHTDEAVLHHEVLEASAAFLQKPFTAMGLVHKVREVLDAKENLR